MTISPHFSECLKFSDYWEYQLRTDISNFCWVCQPEGMLHQLLWKLASLLNSGSLLF
jgi:hypothetical protein